MGKKWTPRELMYDLVAVQSDSFSKMEIEMSQHIYDIICDQDYWKEHPEYCGIYDGNDVLGRTIPWALRRGTTERTIILTGHFDCVEIDSYGALKPYALNPDKLKEEMLKMDYTGDVLKDLHDDNWCFGRGVSDMKGGDADIIYELFKHAEENLCPEVNILYYGVHDEEHQAEGIMQSIGLLNDLKEKYGLDYKYLLNPEPALRNKADDYVYVDGSIGKILPGIVCKGKLCHAGSIMQGINSTLLASNVSRQIEINPALRSIEFGKVTPPPLVLYMKDSKHHYDVSIPEFTDIYCHIPMTKNVSVLDQYDTLKKLCRAAADESLAQYDRSYMEIYGTLEGKPDLSVQVLMYSELEDICREKDPDYEVKKAEMLKIKIDQVNSGEKLIQEAGGFDIIEWTIQQSKITNPMIVIGLLPPYVPAVNNHYMKDFDREGMIKVVEKVLNEEFGLQIDEDPYAMGMSDNSYTGCTDVDQDIEAMKNMITPKELYRIPFAEIGKVAVPSVLLGPWGKDFHQATERVYLPDVDVVTPRVIEAVIASI